MQIEVFACGLKHPKKEKSEDAYFISQNKNIFGVADGVGGWKSKGIDPSIFPNELMQNCKKIADSRRDITPVDLLKMSYEDVFSDGSTTLCMGKIENNILDIIHLGDSGFKIIRNNKVYYSSKEQVFDFNYPYQIGKYNGKSVKNTPEDCEKTRIKLNKGDIILIATDGLFDNIFDREIIEEMNKQGDVAKILVEKAHVFSLDKKRESPFTKKSKYFGGKKDDITSIVIKVF